MSYKNVLFTKMSACWTGSTVTARQAGESPLRLPREHEPPVRKTKVFQSCGYATLSQRKSHTKIERGER